MRYLNGLYVDLYIRIGKSLDIPKYTIVYKVIIMSETTIKIHTDTKSGLDTFREYKNESYDEVIKKVMYIAKTSAKNPKLSKEAIDSIEKARKRMKAGNFITEAEAKKRLGF